MAQPCSTAGEKDMKSYSVHDPSSIPSTVDTSLASLTDAAPVTPPAASAGGSATALAGRGSSIALPVMEDGVGSPIVNPTGGALAPEALPAAALMPLPAAALVPLTKLQRVKASPGTATLTHTTPPSGISEQQTVTFAFAASKMPSPPFFTCSADAGTIQHGMSWEPRTRTYYADIELSAKLIVRYHYTIDGVEMFDAEEPCEVIGDGCTVNVYTTTGMAPKVSSSVTAARVVEALEEEIMSKERVVVIEELYDAIEVWCDTLTFIVESSQAGDAAQEEQERGKYAAACSKVKSLLSTCAKMHGAEPLV